MSRSYVILAATLVGVAGLIGIMRTTSGSSEGIAGAAAIEGVADLGGGTGDGVAADASARVDPDCTLSLRLELGDDDPEVACLETRLIMAGALTGAVPDTYFDADTDAAIRAFQQQHGLVVDGILGPQTAVQIGSWVGTDVLPPDADTCPLSGRSAVVDRLNQRAWLCESGEIIELMPMTSAVSQPDPGVYSVYAKDLNASSLISGEYSEMTHFVAFTYGKFQGARIAFHSVPTYSNGEFVQPLDSVGTAELHGASAGCIRVLPDDAEQIWNWLDIGDTVTVVT